MVYGWWGQPTPLNNMSSSIGMVTFPIHLEQQNMFQTTNQDILGEHGVELANNYIHIYIYRWLGNQSF